MSLLSEAARFPQGRTQPAVIEGRTARPVLWWAALGAVYSAIGIYAIGGWILSGPERTPSGPTDVPTYMWLAIRFQEVVGPIVIVYMFYRFVLRPRRRQGHLTWDGIFFLACIATYWQDPLYNYMSYGFTYNAAAINWGSWTDHIPGWFSQQPGHMVEPPLLAFSWYAPGLFGAVVLMNYLMRRAKARWPQIGTVGLISWAFAAFVITDLVMETIYVRTGTYIFTNPIKGWTLFYGHYYQFPVYECFMWGGLWMAMTCVRYFRDDKGNTVFERGIDSVRTGQKGKALLRFLALSAILNSIFMAWNLGAQWVTTHGSEWPNDIVKRSYFTQGLCGPGTTYACTSPDLPLPRGGSSIHIGPDGGIVVPAGTELPSKVEMSE